MNNRRRALQRMGALVLSFGAMHRAWGAAIVGVRVWPAEDYTRVTLESDQALSARHQLLQNPPRLLVDIDGLTLDPALRELVGQVRPDDPYIAGVRVGQYQPRVVRLVFDLKQPVAPQQFTLAPVAAYQHRLVFDLYPTKEIDPLLALIRDKESAEKTAARDVQDALGELIAKVDKPGARPQHVVNAAFDLFDKLGATEEQLDFPVVYASGLNGWASMEEGAPGEQWGRDLAPLFDTVLSHVPANQGDPAASLQLQISSLDYSTYVGRIGVGRISQGTLRVNQEVLVMEGPEGAAGKAKVQQILKFDGLERMPATEAGPGDIVLVSGIADDLFKATAAWVGRIPGGLGMATALAGAGFGAICGTSTASAATLSATSPTCCGDWRLSA